MSAIVRVTADHIKHGEPKNPMGCPIALAINDQATVADIDVIDTDVYVCDLLALVEGKVRTVETARAHLPDIAREFVKHFDRGQPVQPIEFELTWIDQQGCEVTP